MSRAFEKRRYRPRNHRAILYFLDFFKRSPPKNCPRVANRQHGMLLAAWAKRIPRCRRLNGGRQVDVCGRPVPTLGPPFSSLVWCVSSPTGPTCAPVVRSPPPPPRELIALEFLARSALPFGLSLLEYFRPLRVGGGGKGLPSNANAAAESIFAKTYFSTQMYVPHQHRGSPNGSFSAPVAFLPRS